MGYTHYFQLNKTDNNIKKNFYAASVEFERLYHKMQNFNSLQLDKYSHYYHGKIEIFDGMGIGSPIITSKNIIFNGDDSKDLSLEAFFVHINELPYMNFCKTERKPYDFAVCVCLLCLSSCIKDFRFTSDGDYLDWNYALKWYSRHSVYNIPQWVYDYFNITHKFKYKK